MLLAKQHHLGYAAAPMTTYGAAPLPSFTPTDYRPALGNPLDMFDSPLWTHRKWIVLGGVGLLGLGILALAGKLLR